MCGLEQKQRQIRAFVDQHRKQKEKMFAIGKLVLVFQTKMGSMRGKLRFRWTGPFWIIDTLKRNHAEMGKWFSTKTI